MATVCVGDDGDDDSNITQRRGTMAMARNPSTTTMAVTTAMTSPVATTIAADGGVDARRRWQRRDDSSRWRRRQATMMAATTAMTSTTSPK